MKVSKVLATLMVTALSVGGLAGCGSAGSSDAAGSGSVTATEAQDTASDSSSKKFDGVTLTLLKDADIADAGIKAVADLAKEKLGITIEIESRVGGSDGDNIVKTRLASGDMADICLYNSGSLLAALHPSDYFIDISKETFVSNLDDTYKSTVSIDGATYGVPVSSSQAGAILYNKAIYKKLGLSVPKTWNEFLANCDKIKASGKTALIGTFGDSWTSQVMYLGDNFNVMSAVPDFAEKFEAGEAKYATTPVGVESFQKLVDVQKYYNEDYLAATYDDGCDMLANGEGAQWVMLTQALSNIYELYPDKMDDIGVFAIPGDKADSNGLTVWMPSSLYGNKNSKNVDAVKAFMEFYITKEALDAYAGALLPDGPYCVKGYKLPDNSYKAVREDMQAYFDAGNTKVALEFLTPVKGPNCAAICQAAGSGQTTALEAAQAYDEDCKAQALQLGLNWK